MIRTEISEEALGRLRAAKASLLSRPESLEIVQAKDDVLARYGPAFQPGAIKEIDEQVLRSFLLFENNRHWSGLYRQGNRIVADMPRTRAALAALVDETRPIEERTRAVTEIKGMGKGIITAILHVAYPDRYGVWNNTSQDGLISLDLLPDWPRGASFGERYAAINNILVELGQALEIDLWTLDTIWWHLRTDDVDDGLEASETLPGEETSPLRSAARRFAIEKYLQNYLFDNWSSLELSRDWDLYTRDGEPDAGYEFRTGVGPIDLLARHKREPRWLVIELKRDKTSDTVVGQILRYIGWIQAHLAEAGETVEGLIVATEGDRSLHYALSMTPAISFKSYEVEFRLRDGPTFEEFARR